MFALLKLVNPRVWIGLLVGVLLVSTIVGVYLYGKREGTRVTALEYQAKIDEYKRLHQEALDAENARVVQLEKEHAQAIESLRTKYAAEQATEKAKDAVVIADLNNGIRTLRLRIVRPGGSGAQETPTGTAPSRTDGTETAELAPEVASALYSIAAYGDEAIRQLIGLQSYTLQLYKTCVGTSEEVKPDTSPPPTPSASVTSVEQWAKEASNRSGRTEFAGVLAL